MLGIVNEPNGMPMDPVSNLYVVPLQILKT
jgi:hypothetical protein